MVSMAQFTCVHRMAGAFLFFLVFKTLSLC
jgi:hypothetical protein